MHSKFGRGVLENDDICKTSFLDLVHRVFKYQRADYPGKYNYDSYTSLGNQLAGTQKLFVLGPKNWFCKCHHSRGLHVQTWNA